MKEESKYYTPTIEEFHVGFEYEVQQLEELYGSITYTEEYASFDYEFGDDINLERVRVKLLDKEDIESLGFIESHYSNINQAFYKFKDYTLYQDRTKVVVFFNDNGNNIVKFNGTIKSKSELQQILKMVL